MRAFTCVVIIDINSGVAVRFLISSEGSEDLVPHPGRGFEAPEGSRPAPEMNTDTVSIWKPNAEKAKDSRAQVL